MYYCTYVCLTYYIANTLCENYLLTYQKYLGAIVAA
jgi:hypothetical protein